MAQKPIEVFFSYSREDKPLRDKLEIALSSLKRHGVISSWHDRQILAGEEWQEEIDHHIQTADVILLLISPHFIASEYCYDIELPDAMARHDAGEACVVPILLRPVLAWKKFSFAKLQVYPSGGKPITKWADEDDAFLDVAEGIQQAVEQLLEQRQQQEQILIQWLEGAALPLSADDRATLEQMQKLARLDEGEVQRRIEEISEARSQAAQAAERRRAEEAAQKRQAAEQRQREEQTRLAAEQKKREEEARRLAHRSFTLKLSDRVPLDMIAIPGGKFWMGSPDGVGRNDERPRHEVTIAPFFMGKYPITQAQYQAVMGSNPSHFRENGMNRPVEQVFWEDAIAFCEQLSKMSNRQFRLPSEAEWEYACRSGTETQFYFGETISAKQVNHGNGNGTSDVGKFPPNQFGLYDMHGNVWEWCADHYSSNYKGTPIDGSSWVRGHKESFRLLRGGSWELDPSYCRSAFRLFPSPVFQFSSFGFRVVCV
jgi:formylglycine-generating enzyme required for sulfatase activity